MIVTYSNRTYRITYQSIALVENALGNPNLIQISLTTDCEVKVAPMPEYDINYLPNGEYRSWQLTGINTKLNRKEQHFIYARLERDSKEALLVFSMNDYNVDGTTGEGTAPSEYYYYIKLGKITATDTVEGATVMREVTLDYGYLATPADRTENFFRLRTDANGNEYIITKYHVVSEQSYTSYATPQTQIPSLFEGIPFDNKTIWLNPETKVVEVIGGTGGSDLDVKQMWTALSADTTEQINKSHLTTALSEYATTDSVSTLQTEITKKWTQDDAKIKNWDTAFGWGNHAEAGYAHLANEEIFTGLKHFSVGLTVGAGKHKLYEKDGVVYFDGDLAVTGGITQYALGDTPVSTIMDGVAVDGTTISKEGGVLKVIGGGGSSFDDAQMWKLLGASSAEQINRSHLTTALQGYATESWANSNFLGKTETASNSNKLQNLTWSDFFSRRYHYIDYGAQSTSNFYPIFFFPSDIELDCEIHSDNVGAANAYSQNRIHFQLTAQGWSDAGVSFRILSRNNYNDTEITIGAIGYGGKDGGIAIWVRGGKRYRLYCNKTPNMKTSDFIYGSNGEKYTVGTNLDGGTNSFVNIIWKNDLNRNNGLVATVDGNVYSATKLQNTRTIWGQNFNGEQNVDGNIENTQSVKSKSGVWLDLFGNAGIGFYTANALRGVITQNGNFGIGTEAPLQKLHVAGNILATGDVETANGVFSTSNNTILRKWGSSNVNILSWNWDGAYGDHLTFNIPGTNDQSKWMKLSATLGLVISGGAKIGNYILYQNESTLSIYSDYNQNFTSEYGKETTCLQTSFDGQDPETSSYPSQYPSRCVLALQPRGGWVGIGLRNPTTTLDVNGNILSRGGITQYSDQRAKTIIEQINLPLNAIANSPAIRFKWNGWKQKDDGKTHIGGIAQYVQNILPEVIYNSDDVLTMDYATTGYIFAVNTAKHLLNYETKTDKEINKLKKRVKYLEKQLKKLGYEEANIVDN